MENTETNIAPTEAPGSSDAVVMRVENPAKVETSGERFARLAAIQVPADAMEETYVEDVSDRSESVEESSEQVLETAPQVETGEVSELKAQIAALTEMVNKLSQGKTEVNDDKPVELEKPKKKERINDPFMAQTVLYFGEDLPPHLAAKARDAFEALDSKIGWAQPTFANDAKAQEQIKLAERTLQEIEWTIQKELETKAKSERVWDSASKGVAIDKMITNMANVPGLEGWTARDFAALAYSVPAGNDPNNYFDRLGAEIEKINAEKSAKSPVVGNSAPKVVRNPAPNPPQKSETAVPTAKWDNDKIPTRDEIRRRIMGAARGQ